MRMKIGNQSHMLPRLCFFIFGAHTFLFSMSRYFSLLLVAFFFLQCSHKQIPVASNHQGFHPYSYSSYKTAKGSKGAVVAAHPLASQVGRHILDLGGNAVDAAIATQLALAVVYPAAGNLGGGGFLVARLADGRELAIDYREKAPAAATRDMYLDDKGNPITNLSLDGHLASGVPGTVSGLYASHKYGKLPFTTLLEPAIRLAENGYVITEREARGLNETQEGFRVSNTVMPVFVKKTPWKAGDTLIQKDLAGTLKRMKDKGSAGFYEGETAKLLVEEMKRGKGLITLEDLKNYQAAERKVHKFTYKGYTILSMPLPSSGGVLLQQMLGMLEDRGLEKMKYQSPEAVQLMVEVERRAYADRARYLGDPDFVKVPVEKIVSKNYLEQRMKNYQPGKAGNSDDFDWNKTSIKEESLETTHLSVCDQWGNAVSVTTTLNGGYGSMTVVGGAGFLLNNEMDDFSVKEGQPNMFGALGTKANAIEPGKRMLSSMTPTIVLKDNKPFLIVGTPGGTTIPTSVFQVIVNIIDFQLGPVEAVHFPRFHHQWRPDDIKLEKGFPLETQLNLEKMGYKTQSRGAWSAVELILINTQGIVAVADIRGDDHAEVQK
jgi:gamma-glutamyltranspeptidase / glutathione hydrolase